MKIGIDVESGERSFPELINGALKALQYLPEIKIFIIGNTQKIKNQFPELIDYKNIFFENATEIIKMDEKPILALKRKNNSTVSVGMNLLKNNIINIFFSPGNTGATVASAVMNLGMIDQDIKRPAMATFFPRIGGGETLIIDIGANPDASEIDLLNNAILGINYYKILYKNDNPSFGLLNIGVEQGKGSAITKKAFEFMKDISSFIGNVEGYDIFNGTVDIIVCNGFLGNCILKCAEAMKKFFLYTMRHSLSNSLKENFLAKLLFLFKNKINFYNSNKQNVSQKILPKYFGAAPLLGINGIVLIGHGMCSTNELANAVMLANDLYNSNYISELKKGIKKLLKKD